MEFTPQGNNAWLFQKQYYRGFDWARNKEENYALDFFKKRLDDLRQTQLLPVKNPLTGISAIEMVTTYPGLVTGVGVKHETGSKGEIKMGFEFDYTTGMPVIRGHSIKGKLRAAFPQFHRRDVKYKIEKAYLIHCIIAGAEPTEEGFNQLKNDKDAQQKIKAIEEEIFDGKVNGILLSSYKQDVFFDAYIIQASKHPSTNRQYLGGDSITPHPDALKNPKPLPFLKVLPGVKFQFRFKLNSNDLLTVEQKTKLLTELLLQGGIGAKTNVGYGQFVPISRTSPNSEQVEGNPDINRGQEDRPPANFKGKIKEGEELEGKVMSQTPAMAEVFINGERREAKLNRCPDVIGKLIKIRIGPVSKKGEIQSFVYLRPIS